MILPVADLFGAGQQDIADRGGPVTPVGDVAVRIFQPQVYKGIAAGKGRMAQRVGPQLFRCCIQAVFIFGQRKLDAVRRALHHQLHLPGLAVHQGRFVVLPGHVRHDAQ